MGLEERVVCDWDRQPAYRETDGLSCCRGRWVVEGTSAGWVGAGFTARIMRT